MNRLDIKVTVNGLDGEMKTRAESVLRAAIIPWGIAEWRGMTSAVRAGHIARASLTQLGGILDARELNMPEGGTYPIETLIRTLSAVTTAGASDYILINDNELTVTV